jgi:hypothetical protein
LRQVAVISSAPNCKLALLMWHHPSSIIHRPLQPRTHPNLSEPQKNIFSIPKAGQVGKETVKFIQNENNLLDRNLPHLRSSIEKQKLTPDMSAQSKVPPAEHSGLVSIPVSQGLPCSKTPFFKGFQRLSKLLGHQSKLNNQKSKIQSYE